MALPVARSLAYVIVHRIATALVAAAFCLFAQGTLAAAAPLGTAFTYQGQLKEAGLPATGLYDLQICLFDSAANPIPLSCAADAADVPVEAGLFSVVLDFGSSAFVGQERYLELRVRPGASTGSYTILSPRQLLRPAPEALHASMAGTAPWSGLTGVPAGFADGVDDTGITSIATGAGLSGGPITTSGTISIANGGVVASMIAPGAIGQTQINASEVQVAISGAACPPGTAVSQISGSNPVCGYSSSGLTQISGGGGITANTVGTSVTLGTDSSVQRRSVSPACGDGFALKSLAQDGTPTCIVVPSSGGTLSGTTLLLPGGGTIAWASGQYTVSSTVNVQMVLNGTIMLRADSIGESEVDIWLCSQVQPGGAITANGSGLTFPLPANQIQILSLSAVFAATAFTQYKLGFCGKTTGGHLFTSGSDHYNLTLQSF